MSSKLLDFKLSLLQKGINSAQSVKDLGVISDPTLSFDNHISTVVSSCMLKLSQISHIRFVFNKQLLETVISSPVFRDLQHSSVRTCALATLCITTLSARVGEVCSIKALFILRRLAVVTLATRIPH